jgi:hypothetical protein
MRGAILALPQYAFMAWCLVKHRDKFLLLPSTTELMASHTVSAETDTQQVLQRMMIRKVG